MGWDGWTGSDDFDQIYMAIDELVLGVPAGSYWQVGLRSTVSTCLLASLVINTGTRTDVDLHVDVDGYGYRYGYAWEYVKGAFAVPILGR